MWSYFIVSLFALVLVVQSRIDCNTEEGEYYCFGAEGNQSDFVNFRGTFRMYGINIGTQMSMAYRHKTEKWLLLDTLELSEKQQQVFDGLVNHDVEAVINVHPFHTVHIQATHDRLKSSENNIKWYGSERHVQMFPDIKWEKELVNTKEFASLFEDVLDFNVPQGVDFISDEPNVHFSSVLAYHKRTRTLHVDDTFLYYTGWSWIQKLLGSPHPFKLHLTLPSALQHRHEAAQEFRDWIKESADRYSEVENVVAAHVEPLIGQSTTGDRSSCASDNMWCTVKLRILLALEDKESVLIAHEEKYKKNEPLYIE